jgi:hypothetical protein
LASDANLFDPAQSLPSRTLTEILADVADPTWHLQIDGKRDGLSDARRYA